MSMATKKLFYVDRTIEFPVKGEKKRLLRSPDPQEVPQAIAKEALEKGLIRAASGAAAEPDDDTASGTGGAGSGEGDSAGGAGGGDGEGEGSGA
tara:strand:+ start:2640 stop:2921 length:282 start_codon:yes stop_codon:yes gene_type:complete